MASPVTEAAQRIFADLADPQAVNRDAAGAWKAPLWRALEEAGLTLAWVPEGLGGPGDAAPVGLARRARGRGRRRHPRPAPPRPANRCWPAVPALGGGPPRPRA